MITSIIIYIFSDILYIFNTFLPSWNIYPNYILSGMQYVGYCIMKTNFILPMYHVLQGIIIIAQFEAALFSFHLAQNIINFFRGGKSLDI